jgi:hypothetical protein
VDLLCIDDIVTIFILQERRLMVFITRGFAVFILGVRLRRKMILATLEWLWAFLKQIARTHLVNPVHQRTDGACHALSVAGLIRAKMSMCRSRMRLFESKVLYQSPLDFWCTWDCIEFLGLIEQALTSFRESAVLSFTVVVPCFHADEAFAT